MFFFFIIIQLMNRFSQWTILSLNIISRPLYDDSVCTTQRILVPVNNGQCFHLGIPSFNMAECLVQTSLGSYLLSERAGLMRIFNFPCPLTKLGACIQYNTQELFFFSKRKKKTREKKEQTPKTNIVSKRLNALSEFKDASTVE